jgi:putative membrane protein
MAAASQVLTGLVAALHVYFLVLEMFLWTTPTGQRVFGRTAEEQESSKVLAANQGLYNGFLAAGLVWSLVAGDLIALPMRTFFLGCVVVAGYGG